MSFQTCRSFFFSMEHKRQYSNSSCLFLKIFLYISFLHHLKKIVWVRKERKREGHGKTCLWEPGEVERKHKAEGINETYCWKKERCPVNVRRGLLLWERMDRANWEKKTKCWERHAQNLWTSSAEEHRPWGFTGSADSAIRILITYRPTGCFSSTNPVLTVHIHTCLTAPLALDIKQSHVNTG